MMSQTGKQIITICILPNISKSKGNQTIKFGQLIDYKVRLFLFFFYLYIRSKCCTNAIKTNYITFQTIDTEKCLILIFCKRVWDELPHHIFCMIFREKYFSCYILLTEQISLYSCLYFLRY